MERSSCVVIIEYCSARQWTNLELPDHEMMGEGKLMMMMEREKLGYRQTHILCYCLLPILPKCRPLSSKKLIPQFRTLDFSS